MINARTYKNQSMQHYHLHTTNNRALNKNLYSTLNIIISTKNRLSIVEGLQTVTKIAIHYTAHYHSPMILCLAKRIGNQRRGQITRRDAMAKGLTGAGRERSCLAAESLPELAELVLVHLALALLLHAVRPHLGHLSAAILNGGGVPDRI